MKNLSILFVMTLSLAAFGCKKGGDCAAAIDHGKELSKADMAKMPDADKMMGKLRDLGVQRCKEDKWSDEALKCMVDAKTETEAQGCYHKLTPEQSGKMNKAAMEMMSPPAPAAPAAGADTGGAGSAMAGSAAGGDMGGSGSAAAPK